MMLLHCHFAPNLQFFPWSACVLTAHAVSGGHSTTTIGYWTPLSATELEAEEGRATKY
jgi:hypothetical protein